MSASIHPINTVTLESTVSNLVTRVKMISRQSIYGKSNNHDNKGNCDSITNQSSHKRT